MGQSKIAVFTELLGGDRHRAEQANAAFEAPSTRPSTGARWPPCPGPRTPSPPCATAGMRLCLTTGFSPATRDRIIAALGMGGAGRPGAVPRGRRPGPAVARHDPDRRAPAADRRRGRGGRGRGHHQRPAGRDPGRGLDGRRRPERGPLGRSWPRPPTPTSSTRWPSCPVCSSASPHRPLTTRRDPTAGARSGEVVEVVEPDDPADGHTHGLLGVVGHGGEPGDRRVLGGRRVRGRPDATRRWPGCGPRGTCRSPPGPWCPPGRSGPAPPRPGCPRSCCPPACEDVGRRDADGHQVPGRGLRLGVSVARLLGAGDHDGRRVVLVPQQRRLSSRAAQVGRRHPVVLGRAHHHDGAGRPGLVALAGPPHLVGGHPRIDDDGDHEVLDQPEREAEEADGEQRGTAWTGISGPGHGGAAGPVTSRRRRRPPARPPRAAGPGSGRVRAPRGPRTAAGPPGGR